MYTKFQNKQNEPTEDVCDMLKAKSEVCAIESAPLGKEDFIVGGGGEGAVHKEVNGVWALWTKRGYVLT